MHYPDKRLQELCLDNSQILNSPGLPPGLFSFVLQSITQGLECIIRTSDFRSFVWIIPGYRTASDYPRGCLICTPALYPGLRMHYPDKLRKELCLDISSIEIGAFIRNFSFAGRMSDIRIGDSPGKLLGKESVIMAYVAVALLAIKFTSNHHNLQLSWLNDLIHQEPYFELKRLCWWIFINLVFFAFIPFLLIRLWLGDKLKNYGLQMPGKGTLKIYIVFLLIMLPLVYAVSFTTAFQNKYPYYRLSAGEPLWPAFWTWEFLYFFQFAALEFFFRGFMIQGLKPSIGIYAIPVMVIPYALIHYTKPAPEAFGSIIAGFALGYLSYTKNSIWPGVFLHFSVALSMDILALVQKGLL